MKILEKYTGDKTYMFPNGAIATPQAVVADFPAIQVFAHVIETDESGEVLWAVQNLAAMRSMHGIDPALPEAEAISALQDIINAPPPEVEDMPDPLADALSKLADVLESNASGDEVAEALLILTGGKDDELDD